MIAKALTLLFFVSALDVLGLGGYQFVEGRSRTSIRFQLYKNLIVIPAQLNDTLSVRLILDTGTRSLLLYGKQFAQLGNLLPKRKVNVSGWGSPGGVQGTLSYPNTVDIGEIHGTSLGIAVIPHRKLFDEKPRIDGIIGYELFVRFVVEINYQTNTIHLYDKMPLNHVAEFQSLPLEINSAMPQVTSSVRLTNDKSLDLKLLIDTGSSLGLTVFSKTRDGFPSSDDKRVVGIGLNGTINGFDLYVKDFLIGPVQVDRIQSFLVDVDDHPDEDFTYSGSLGADFLRKHIVVFDYPSSKLFLKKADS